MNNRDFIERPLDPPEASPPKCPVCGEECELVYRDADLRWVGCDVCLDALDAWSAFGEDDEW